MSDPTATPVIAPDLSAAPVAAAETAIVKVAGPFIPAKVRATVYAIAGALIVVAPPVAAVLGGEVGVVLDGVASAAAVASSVLALSHINK